MTLAPRGRYAATGVPRYCWEERALLARGSSAEDEIRIKGRRPASSDSDDSLGTGVGAGHECLSADEELFVRAFVEYWIRRGATLMDGDE